MQHQAQVRRDLWRIVADQVLRAYRTISAFRSMASRTLCSERPFQRCLSNPRVPATPGTHHAAPASLLASSYPPCGATDCLVWAQRSKPTAGPLELERLEHYAPQCACHRWNMPSPLRHSASGAIEGQFDTSILRSARSGIVGSYRISLAVAMRCDQLGSDAL
jgi:hypothetical protein